jgi:hypothetical protein
MPTCGLRLGRAGRDYWEREHTVARMATDYERVIAIAAELPMPAFSGPAHLHPHIGLAGVEVLARP